MRRLKDISDKQLGEKGVGTAYSAFNAAIKKAENPDAPTMSEIHIAMQSSIILGALAVSLSEKEQKLLVEVIEKIEGIVKQELEKRDVEAND